MNYNSTHCNVNGNNAANCRAGDGFSNLTIGHGNIQGGMKGLSKSDNISMLIREHALDIFSINETNLNDTIATSTLNIPHGYDFIRKDRDTGSRGGCGMLVSKNCNYSIYNINVPREKIEAVWIKLKDSKVFICGFYRSSNYCKLDIFLEYMTECMKKLRVEQSGLMVKKVLGKEHCWMSDSLGDWTSSGENSPSTGIGYLILW